MKNYTYLFLSLLAASCTHARALPQESSTSLVVCGTGKYADGSGLDYSENEALVDELSAWIYDGGQAEYGTDLEHANSPNFPIYFTNYHGDTFTIALVSVLPGYYVPLDGIRSALSSI
jgi:hypothetical protein